MIRFANKDDIYDIMNFIDSYWKKGHILGNNEKLFRYEFENEEGLNFVLSVNDDGIIDGIEGFIPYSKHNKDSMLAMWKVNKTTNPILGIELLQYIQSHTDSRLIAAPGINKKTIGIYEFLGMTTGKMNHWYRLGKCKDFTIAKVENNTIPSSTIPSKSLVRFHTFDELASTFDFVKYKDSNPVPFKEAWYIQKRYFNHPIYEYEVYGVKSENMCNTLLVFRKQPLQNAVSYRFVDVIGDYSDVYACTLEIDKLMMNIGAEYVDFYEIGMDSKMMLAAGWKQVENSANIIPNYFSPFVQENIDIYYCTSDTTIHLFKADGDQDRPN